MECSAGTVVPPENVNFFSALRDKEIYDQK